MKKKTDLPKRYFLQLAHVRKTESNVAGGLYSEKLDGMRMFWDGGATRGLPVYAVPFANVMKQDRILVEQYSTGLWSRYGHPIFAPDSFLDKLPDFFLDGELYLGRKMFQQTMSIAKTFPENRIDSNWNLMKYKVFDTPPIDQVFRLGEINDEMFQKVITPDMGKWLLTKKPIRSISARQFASQLKFLDMFLVQNDVVQLHEQKALPAKEHEARTYIRNELERLNTLGAEGLVIRYPHDMWEPTRSHNMLKVKMIEDAEAIVVGYTTGEIGTTGKLHGKIGALIVDYLGIVFELAGLTDEERLFADAESEQWALARPGVKCPDFIKSKHFPIGRKITFKYRELSDTGVPKEARYHRIRLT